MLSSALLFLAAVSPAFASVAVTHPVATDVWTAGQPQTISWQESNAAPLLAQFGNASVGLYVGSVNVQTQIQSIAPSVDVSTTASIVFTPDATAGANGNAYFIRIQSINAKDPNNAAFPALAFSAKFNLTGMTGTFSPEAQAAISGSASSNASSASAPSANAPSASASSPSSSSSSTSASVSNTKTGSAANTTGAPSGSTKDNGASSLSSLGALTYAAGVVAIFSAMLI